MGIVKLVQGTKEWLDWRDGGVGASEVAVLAFAAESLGFTPCPVDLGKAPGWLSTPRQLYRRKKGLDAPVSVNANMARGNRLEPLIRSKVNGLWGSRFAPVCIEAGKTSPWRVSLDGYQVKGSQAAILEIKSPSHRYGSIPVYYHLQVAYQRAVATVALRLGKVRSGLVAGYEDKPESGVIGDDFEMFPVQGDAVLERWLLELVAHFWKEYILKEVEPPACAGDVTFRHDPEFLSAAQKYASAVAMLDVAKTASDKARKVLLELVGDFTGAVAGGGLKMVNVTRQGSVDYKTLLAALLPDTDVEPYRKPSTTTVMVKVDTPAGDANVTPIRRRKSA